MRATCAQTGPRHASSADHIMYVPLHQIAPRMRRADACPCRQPRSRGQSMLPERSCHVRNRVRQSRTLGSVGNGVRQQPPSPGPLEHLPTWSSPWLGPFRFCTTDLLVGLSRSICHHARQRRLTRGEHDSSIASTGKNTQGRQEMGDAPLSWDEQAVSLIDPVRKSTSAGRAGRSPRNRVGVHQAPGPASV